MFWIYLFFLLLGANIGHASVGVADLMYQSSGARALSMGGAFTAVADDSSYPFWNPAGLHFQDARWTYFDFQNFHNYNYHFASSLILKDKGGRIGLTGVLDISPGIEAYDDVGNLTGTYSDTQGLANVTGGDRLAQDLYWGVSVRSFFHNIYDSTMFGVAGDVGFLWQMSPRVRLGAVWHAPLSAVSTGHNDFDTVDSMTSFGIAHWIDQEQSILFSADVNMNRFGIHHWSVGGEFWLFPQSFAVRGGYHSLNGMSLGLGLNVGGMRMDYAFLNNAYFGNFHQLSFSLMLGSPEAPSGQTQEHLQTWTRYSRTQPILIKSQKSNDIAEGVVIMDETREYALNSTLEGFVIDIPLAERKVGRHTLEVVLKDKKGSIERQNLFVDFED